MRKGFLLFLGCMAFGACSRLQSDALPNPPLDSTAVTASAASTSSHGAATQASGMSLSSTQSSSALQPRADVAVYADFEPGVIGKGKSVVLFFHAPWCPFCRRTDAILSTLYREGSASRSTYKVDYDTAIALKVQYAVVTQDTMVLLDAEGKDVRRWLHPTENDLRAMIGWVKADS